jgi:uncharacterized damage-inducible protein DinB
MRIGNLGNSSHIGGGVSKERPEGAYPMTSHPHAQLIRYKQWADRDLCDVVAGSLHRLDDQDAMIVRRVLDHFHVVDKIFRHHLTGTPHGFHAARSETIPEFADIAHGVAEVDAWYTSYVASLREEDFDQIVNFTFSNGSPARMRRGDILLHVCMHGTYHRGNAGIVLQKNGIAPNDDRFTDFLDRAA